jgi:hypothetical protein
VIEWSKLLHYATTVRGHEGARRCIEAYSKKLVEEPQATYDEITDHIIAKQGKN